MENMKQKIAEIITHTHKTPLEQADEILLLFSVVWRSEQLCPRCNSSLIYRRVHTDGYSCNNCFHDWA